MNARCNYISEAMTLCQECRSLVSGLMLSVGSLRGVLGWTGLSVWSINTFSQYICHEMQFNALSYYMLRKSKYSDSVGKHFHIPSVNGADVKRRGFRWAGVV